MKKIFTIIFLFFSLMSNAQTTSDNLVAEAVTFIENKNYESAINKCLQALKLNNDNAYAWYNKALANQNLGKTKQAISDYSQAIKLNSDFVEAYNNRGILNAKNNNHVDALNDFNIASLKKVDFYSASFNQGLCRFLQKDYRSAITTWTKLEQQNANFEKCTANIALSYILLNDNTNARLYANKALKNNPNNATAFYVLAKCYEADNATELACKNYEKASNLGILQAELKYKKICKP